MTELWRDVSLVEHARELVETALADLPRLAHVRAVAALAEQVAGKLAPTALYPITAAAYLHDIGYAASLTCTGFHPIDGAKFAQSAGFPRVVVGLIAHHTGAWSEAAERGLTDQLAHFRTPPTPFLDILTYADLHSGPTGESVSARARLAEILERYEPTHPVHRAIKRSQPALLAAVARVRTSLAGTERSVTTRNERRYTS